MTTRTTTTTTDTVVRFTRAELLKLATAPEDAEIVVVGKAGQVGVGDTIEVRWRRRQP